MKDFSIKLQEILNHGALNLAIGIGYKNRIFDRMEDINSPVTIIDLALASGLNERYLREWLGIMVTAHIIQLDRTSSGDDTYFLPPEHAAFLTRKAGSNNLGVYMQEIPLLTSCAMESVNQGFSTGAGIPFSKYPDFQQFMAELSTAKHKKLLISEFVPSVDNGQLMDRLSEGIEVCDLGCGQGVALNLMANEFPNSRFTGIDNHGEAIEMANSDAKESGLGNTEYKIVDAATIDGKSDWFQRFDYICAFDSIHDQTQPLKVLKGIKYMLRKGGLFSMVDIKASSHQANNIEHSMGPFLYTVSLMHCMPVGLNENGTGLGMMWGREHAESLLKEAGFESVEINEMGYDPFNLHYLCR